MIGICTILCSTFISFFGVYPKEANDAISFINDNKTVVREALSALSKDEQLIALSIVAPEISQFSSVLDFVELRTLYIMYLNTGQADFSVGYFQMKPSFIELLEKQIKRSKHLYSKYKDVIPTGSNRRKREFRLKKLSSLSGQLRYLAAFIDIVNQTTSSLHFTTSEEKLRHWATLYNSGLKLKEPDVLRFQKLNLFPKFEKRFNYSSVSVEFYYELKKYGW